MFWHEEHISLRTAQTRLLKKKKKFRREIVCAHTHVWHFWFKGLFFQSKRKNEKKSIDCNFFACTHSARTGKLATCLICTQLHGVHASGKKAEVKARGSAVEEGGFKLWTHLSIWLTKKRGEERGDIIIMCVCVCVSHAKTRVIVEPLLLLLFWVKNLLIEMRTIHGFFLNSWNFPGIKSRISFFLHLRWRWLHSFRYKKKWMHFYFQQSLAAVSRILVFFDGFHNNFLQQKTFFFL